jgi:hypothetical protein
LFFYHSKTLSARSKNFPSPTVEQMNKVAMFRQLSRLSRAANVRKFATIKYASSHEYIKLEGDIGVVGITDHAASALGYCIYPKLEMLL